MQSAQEIGALLRRIREEKGLSPDQVQAETKIRLRYLEALESGDEAVIPGEVYYKGFLRFYANHLGLDGHELVEQFKQWKDTQRAEQQQASDTAAKAVRKPRRVNMRRLGLVFGLLVLAAAVIAGGVWAVLAYQQRAANAGANNAPPVVTPGDNTSGGTAPGTPPAGTTPGNNPPDAPAIEVTKQDLGAAGLRYLTTGTSVKVEVEASGLCWVHVVADGALIFENDLAPGARAVWEAKERLTVRYGNLGGVKFSVNGVPQDVAGGDGDVRTVTYELKH